MLKKTMVALSAAALITATAAPAYSHPLPPPPGVPGGGGGGVGAPVIGTFACVGGIFLAGIYHAVVHKQEMASVGFCGLGSTAATCETIRQAHYGPGLFGETPEMVKQQRLAEHNCFKRVSVPPRKVHKVCTKGGTMANGGCTTY